MPERKIKMQITVTDKERLNEEQAVGAFLCGVKEGCGNEALESIIEIKTDSTIVFNRPQMEEDHPSLFEKLEDEDNVVGFS